ncbi:MAG: PAS domain S-box protein [Rhodospirillales bacterium]|nr:PAS domain S-box protein [Rhodospirillales bacterium]
MTDGVYEENDDTTQGSQRPRHRRSWPSIAGTAEQRASRGLSILEDITRLISEWVWETDTQGNISYVSDRVNEVLGVIPLQIIGKTFAEMGTFLTETGDELDINWTDPFREALFKTQDASGAEKLFLVSGIPFYDPESWSFRGFSGTAEDITERINAETKLIRAQKELEARVIERTEALELAQQAKVELLTNEQRFRALYNQSPLGITVQDYSGAKRQIDQLRDQGISDIYTHLRTNKDAFLACFENIVLTDANETQIKMFGTSSLEEYIAQSYTNSLDGEVWQESYLQELTAFANDEVTYSIEVSDVQADGTPIEIRMISRISDEAHGDWSEIISTHEDITERKELDRMKSQFVSTVSHELRTPLTSIKGALGMVTNGTLGELPDAVNNMIDLAYKNTDRLVSLVNDILEIEKIDSGVDDYDFRPLNLSDLVSEAIKMNEGYMATYGDRQLVTKIAPSVMVGGDAFRLSQVVTNLLSNAIKFSPIDSEIEISVSTDGDRVTVLVTDHGDGIPEDFKGQIFQRFAQADNSDSRSVGGTGLGLSISKSIIETHGGTIGFESDQGVGTIFFFTLSSLG